VVPRAVEVVIHITPEKEDLVTHTVLAFMFIQKAPKQGLTVAPNPQIWRWKEEQAEQVGFSRGFHT